MKAAQRYFFSTFFIFSLTHTLFAASPLEDRLYKLSALTSELTEKLQEENIEGNFYSKALQLERYAYKAHDHYLRGASPECLRGDFSRLAYYIQEIKKECSFQSDAYYSAMITQLESLAKEIDLHIADLETHPGDYPRQEEYWLCRAGGYKLGIYFYPYNGRAFVKETAMQRALDSCNRSPKFLTRCFVENCTLIKN